ncbi:GNAT family N-acetyltransferase [Arthrobacter sp. zg-Y820]|uniref:GNAT family N-acetyltransferase n=1 Tax=Arthrobacter sp. zg-Y820 TaxID=2894192 RepID=UPI003FA4D2AC
MWNGADLVAFADILFGYPDPAAAYIGLFIVHGDHPGKGLGRELHDAVLARVHRQSSAERLRLGIVEKNAAAAEPFWRALGCLPTGERKTVPLRQTQQYRHPLGTAHRTGSLKSTESRPVEDPLVERQHACAPGERWVAVDFYPLRQKYAIPSTPR